LQFDALVKEARQQPVAGVEHHLRVLGGAGLVTARQVAVAEAVEEEGVAEEEQYNPSPKRQRGGRD
jgi:hypothetical protein